MECGTWISFAPSNSLSVYTQVFLFFRQRENFVAIEFINLRVGTTYPVVQIVLLVLRLVHKFLNNIIVGHACIDGPVPVSIQRLACCWASTIVAMIHTYDLIGPGHATPSVSVQLRK